MKPPRTALHAVVLALLALSAAVAGAYVHAPHDLATETARPALVVPGGLARPTTHPVMEQRVATP